MGEEPVDAGEDYSDEQALSIWDESIRFHRRVRNIVLGTAAAVATYALVFGLFLLMQALQNGLPSYERNPNVFVVPASGSLLTTAFGALLAVIIAVWFSPNSFRLGQGELPSTIARELATRQTVRVIARLCVLLALTLAAWAFISSLATGPATLDVVRTIAPTLLGIGLAYWSAAAEVRLDAEPSQKLQWAQYHREVQRLRGVIRRENGTRLSKRAVTVQSAVVFVVVPVVAWGIGLVIAPAPNIWAVIFRLLMTAVVTVIGFFVLRQVTYRLIARELLAASLVVGGVLLGGCVMTAGAITAGLTPSAHLDALHLGPIGRSILAISVITFSGPFLLLSILARPRLFGRRPGLIYYAAMKRYVKELARTESKMTTLDKAAEASSVPEKGKQSYARAAWAALALFAIAPFNFMFDALAFQETRGGRRRGRAWAVLALVLGVIVSVGVFAVLVYMAWFDPRLVYCAPHSTAVCLTAH